ncbi:MAG: TauD/TfdA family dioxygenase [Pseudomonadota bacterium]
MLTELSDIGVELGVRVTTDFKSGGLPVLVEPEFHPKKLSERADIPWHPYKLAIKEVANALLPKHGGVLFRGFTKGIGNPDYCHRFAKMFGNELLSYEFGSTPRTDLGEGVYTATEYPSHQIIPLHNEQAYTLQWPLNIWFHCVTAPKLGGETPIADSRRIYEKIPVDIRQRFEQKKLLYVRNYGNGLDLPWSKVFNTDNRNDVESFCRNHHIGFQWKDDGELKTWQLCQATAKHLITNEWVWFNQAHLFHISNVEESAREVLLDIVELEDLPRNVYYGDGSEIEDAILEHIRGVLDEESILFPWQEGDFLMLDNMLAAHGRSTFEGDRKVVVAMANGYDSTAQ